jgi:cytochrome c553
MKFALVTAFLLSSIGLVNVANAASVEKGQALAEKANCASCHGQGLNAPVSPAYPRIAGQSADYIYYALKAYEAGDSNKLYGRNNAVMSALIKSQNPSLTDSDLKDIAAYVASLPGSLVIKK